MKTTIILLLCLVSVIAIGETAPDAFRVWTDQSGTTLKAEYVRTEVESVILRREDGSELKIPIQSLSENDKNFVRLKTPPRIEINMEPSVDSYTVGYLGNGGYDYTVRYQVVEPSVVLRKVSVEPYEGPLTMQVIILGRIREVNRYLIIDNNVVPFSFTGKQSYEFKYVGYPVDLRQIKGSWKSGIEYEGYLVAIRDSQGQLVAAKASKLAMEENADALTKAAVGSMLTRRLKVITPRVVVPGASGFEQPQLSF